MGREEMFSIVYAKCTQEIGGRAVTKIEVRDFNHVLNVCNLEDRGFRGSKYTWWSGRTNEECIFKRLDRVLTNDKMQDIFPILEVEHLVRSGYDYAPLSITSEKSREDVNKPFIFLNFWLKEDFFMELIQNHWMVDFEGDPLSLFHHKLKGIKKALTQWSKQTFGFMKCNLKYSQQLGIDKDCIELRQT
ncbi:hypothetical protein H5410_050428 [Solanum commersonii]|uniref:Reverse transcriptase n=1 Tax=Solanum commersonii TaxID=4109 RepID=A0A9J5WVG3_SOLCO|nr:hypothetical protein H5410_050428 [Solanum commersonii]